jgi:hypothetical protein
MATFRLFFGNRAAAPPAAPPPALSTPDAATAPRNRRQLAPEQVALPPLAPPPALPPLAPAAMEIGRPRRRGSADTAASPFPAPQPPALRADDALGRRPRPASEIIIPAAFQPPPPSLPPIVPRLDDALLRRRTAAVDAILLVPPPAAAPAVMSAAFDIALQRRLPPFDANAIPPLQQPQIVPALSAAETTPRRARPAETPLLCDAVPFAPPPALPIAIMAAEVAGARAGAARPAVFDSGGMLGFGEVPETPAVSEWIMRARRRGRR